MQTHPSTVPASTPSPAEQRQLDAEQRRLDLIVEDFREAEKKLADSVEDFGQNNVFQYYADDWLSASQRLKKNAPAKLFMSRWLKACHRSLDKHFPKLVALISKRHGMNGHKGVHEAKGLVRDALLHRELNPAATLNRTWKQFHLIIPGLPLGIGNDRIGEHGHSVGEELTPFCLRNEETLWTHLDRLSKEELARIDDQRMTQVDDKRSPVASDHKKSKPLSPFYEFAGPLYLKALQASPTHRVNTETLCGIGEKLHNSRFKVPLDYLERFDRERLAKYNQEYPRAAIKTWPRLVSSRFRSAARKVLARAAYRIRTQILPK